MAEDIATTLADKMISYITKLYSVCSSDSQNMQGVVQVRTEIICIILYVDTCIVWWIWHLQSETQYICISMIWCIVVYHQPYINCYKKKKLQYI